MPLQQRLSNNETYTNNGVEYTRFLIQYFSPHKVQVTFNIKML
jgi:hypothetical protein